jgi:hypothetical protein
MGGPHRTGHLGLRHSQDPRLCGPGGPSLRWAREVQLSTPPAPLTAHADCLTTAEFADAAHRLRLRADIPLPQGPLAAIAQTLKFLGWQLSGYNVQVYTGDVLELEHGSAAMLRHYIVQRLQHLQEQSLDTLVSQRPTELAIQQPHWPLVRRFLRSKRPTRAGNLRERFHTRLAGISHVASVSLLRDMRLAL